MEKYGQQFFRNYLNILEGATPLAIPNLSGASSASRPAPRAPLAIPAIGGGASRSAPRAPQVAAVPPPVAPVATANVGGLRGKYLALVTTLELTAPSDEGFFGRNFRRNRNYAKLAEFARENDLPGVYHPDGNWIKFGVDYEGLDTDEVDSTSSPSFDEMKEMATIGVIPSSIRDRLNQELADYKSGDRSLWRRGGLLSNILGTPDPDSAKELDSILKQNDAIVAQDQPAPVAADQPALDPPDLTSINHGTFPDANDPIVIARKKAGFVPVDIGTVNEPMWKWERDPEYKPDTTDADSEKPGIPPGPADGTPAPRRGEVTVEPLGPPPGQAAPVSPVIVKPIPDVTLDDPDAKPGREPVSQADAIRKADAETADERGAVDAAAADAATAEKPAKSKKDNLNHLKDFVGLKKGGLRNDPEYKDAIKQLQKKLGIKADGIYGPNTRAAVRDFQTTHKLAVDGDAGPQTIGKMVELQKAEKLEPKTKPVKPEKYVGPGAHPDDYKGPDAIEDMKKGIFVQAGPGDPSYDPSIPRRGALPIPDLSGANTKKHNAAVKLQKELNRAGANLDVDGIVGPKTHAAMMDPEIYNKVSAERKAAEAAALAIPKNVPLSRHEEMAARRRAMRDKMQANPNTIPAKLVDKTPSPAQGAAAARGLQKYVVPGADPEELARKFYKDNKEETDKAWDDLPDKVKKSLIDIGAPQKIESREGLRHLQNKLLEIAKRN